MARLEFHPVHKDFGARVEGADLRAGIDEDLLEEIRAGIDQWSFLWFPDQPFDDDRQLALTEALGEPEPGHVAYGEDGKIEYFGTIGNVQPDGAVLGNADRKTVFLTGNNMWHSDSSFREVPSYVSIMCAYETPDEGGETLFVSARSGFDRLPEERQAELEPLIGVHDYVFSRSKVAPDAVSPSLAASLPPVRQRLVRRNPGTGARNLYLGSHLREIEGWPEAKGRALIDELTADVVRDDAVYAHPWRPGDLVIWDNRCLLHRGAGYDADRYRRYMRQTRVRGSGSTLEE